MGNRELMIATFLAIAPFCLLSQAIDWDEFKSLHKVNYANQLEETMRRSVFEQNKAFIEKFNAEQTGKDGFKLEVNKFADRTDEELIRFGSRKELDRSESTSVSTVEKFKKLLDGLDLPPEELDWTKHGRVTPVKDEGHCHAHWAYSAVGALEGQMKVQNKTMVSLSAQNVIDCSESNQGCTCGYIPLAWADIHDEGGVEAEETYPYVGKEGNCTFDQSRALMSVKSYLSLPFGEEEYLRKFLANFGPVSSFINSKPKTFKFYKDGVYNDKSCSGWTLDRGVLVVGYGRDRASGKDYWLIKNSWGTNWGIDGYMKLARNQDNMCGVSSSPWAPQI